LNVPGTWVALTAGLAGLANWLCIVAAAPPLEAKLGGTAIPEGFNLDGRLLPVLDTESRDLG